MKVKRKPIVVFMVMLAAFLFMPFTAFAEEGDNIPVTGIGLDPTQITLEEGSYQTIEATIVPGEATDPTILWRSGDEDIATVEDGIVTGIAEGDTQITVSTPDGTCSAVCDVTVIKAERTDITICTIQPIGDQVYTGKEITPEPIVQYEDQTLVKDTDYTLEYVNNTNAGSATAVIKGMGDYAGSATVGFEIKPATLKSATLSTTTYTYKNVVRTPAVTVKGSADTSNLTKGTDFTVQYPDGRKAAGKYTVTIKGKGNYTGTLTKTFTINPAALKSATLSTTTYTYKNTVRTPAVTVKGSVNNTKLVKGMEYSVKYPTGRKNAGKYTVTITGKGNYTGTLKKTFTIKRAPLKSATLSTTSYIYNKKVKTPSVSILGSVNKKKLVKGTEYTVKYPTGRKAVGKYNVKITGKGNYTGTLTRSFTIKPSRAGLTSAKVTSGKMNVVAKAKPSAYGGGALQIAYKPVGGAWRYAKTASKSKVVKVYNKKKYIVKVRAYKKIKGKTYYGAWSKTITSVKKIKVKFNGNKGKVNRKSKTIWTNGKYGELPKAKRSGYKFRGWYTKKTGGKKVTAKTYSQFYNNHTLYAHWFGPKGSGGKISKSEYKRIKVGMTYSDVCYLIGGKGDRISAYTDKDWVDTSYWTTISDGYWEPGDWVDTSYWRTVNDGYWEDGEWIDESYEEYVDSGYQEPDKWVDTSYRDYVDDGYWSTSYIETYWFDGQKEGFVEFEFADGILKEIFTYGFK